MYPCNHCKRQVSLSSGTPFPKSRLPLRTCFLAIYLLTQRKNGISTPAVPPTAWSVVLHGVLLRHKPMQAMVERDGDHTLGGIAQMDDPYWGGERHGGVPDLGHPIFWRVNTMLGNVKNAMCGLRTPMKLIT